MTDLRQEDAIGDYDAPDDRPGRPPKRGLRYNPRDTRGDHDFDAAERNSRRVRVLRYVLPGIAIVAIGIFWASARFIPGDMTNLVETAAIDTTSNSVVMQSPEISGFEGTRRAYNIRAETAVQSLDDPKVVTFNNIDGKLGLDGAGEATLDATIGVYDGNKNTLTLRDGVRVSTNTGYSGTIGGASVDLAAGSMVSDTPLEIITAEGTIRANGVTVLERGKRIKFTNGVSVTYMPPAELVTRSGQAGDVAPAEQP